MRRIILGFIAAVLATLTLTGVQAATTSASASSACDINTAPQGNVGSYGGYVNLGGVYYRSSCVSWTAVPYGPSHNYVFVYGAIKDTASDGCAAGFSYRLYINGAPGAWKLGGTSVNEPGWDKFSQDYALIGRVTGIQVQAYRQCAGGATSALGDALYYSL